MVYKTDLKKPSKQLTMETRRDEKKNPRICYPFPRVLCIATGKRRRITILLLSLSSYSPPLCFPLKTFSQRERERFSSFSFPIFASYHEWNLMVKCFLSLLKFIICKIRPRDSQWRGENVNVNARQRVNNNNANANVNQARNTEKYLTNTTHSLPA